jgi:hypothetical protein
MQKYINSAFSSRPVMPLKGAEVTVTTSNGDLATLYSDNAGTLMGNPIYTDDGGNYSFYAADGRYTITIKKTGFQTQVLADVLLEDPSDQVADLAALQLADYASLRQYTGPRKSVYVTGYLGTAAPSGIAGMFVRDDHDTSTADDGGVVIVSSNGVRWKRAYKGEALPEWFGAKGFGVDDTLAVQAAMNTGKYKLSMQYSIFAKLTAPANSRGIGPGILSKIGNFDMIELGSGAQIRDIALNGNGSTRTGRGIVITGGTDQRIINCDILGMDGYCVEYTASQAGLRSTISGGTYYRNDLTAAAVKYPDSETNGDRRLVNVDCLGGVLADLAGSSTTIISNCDTTGLLFNANTKKAIVTGNRMAILGGTMIVLGVDSVIEGNCIAGNVTVGSGSQNNTIGRNSYANGFSVLDQSGNSTNYVDTLGDTFTPQWLASGTAPAIGNGTLIGRVTRSGKRLFVSFEIAFGTTTTFGSGTYTFKLSPEYDVYTVKAVSVGSVQSLKAGIAFHTGSVTVAKSGLPAFVLYSEGGTNSWGATSPVTWASGDSIKFSVELEIG